MKKRFIFIVITIGLFTPSFAQDEIVFKNMAASFERKLSSYPSFNNLEKDFVHTAIITFSLNDQDFNRSLQKLIRKEDSLLSNKSYLIEGALHYYFDYNIKKDSVVSPLTLNLKLFSQRICECLRINDYATKDSLKNNIYLYCLRNLLNDSVQKNEFEIVFYQNPHINNQAFRNTTTFLSLAKYCRYYRTFLIKKIIEESSRVKERTFF